MQMLSGVQISQTWQKQLAQRVEALKHAGVTPGLAVILVGSDPASVLYTTMKERASHALGLVSKKIVLEESATTNEVIQAVRTLNGDPAIHGILVQLPLPETVTTSEVLAAISPEKDADGLNPLTLGRLLVGEATVIPATPRGILELLDQSALPTAGKHVVIVGRSNILGKPLAAMFLNRDATVTICHSKTSDLASFTKMADIVVMDTGVAGLLTGDMVRPGTIVIDAGITQLPNGKVTGDADFESLKAKVAAITPVPGGVGPMTIASLLANTVELAERSI